MDQINERLIRIENDISTVKGKVAQLEDGLNYTNSELAEMKEKLEKKAEKGKLKDLKHEVVDLRHRSRRNNLVFYNIPEKAEGQDCAAFMKGFINTHMGLEAICGEAEIQRAHRTPTKVLVNNNKKPRPVHVAFLKYTDKVKILSNAAARLKDNPYQSKKLIAWRWCRLRKRDTGASKDPHPFQETFKKQAWARTQSFHCLPRYFEVLG